MKKCMKKPQPRFNWRGYDPEEETAYAVLEKMKPREPWCFVFLNAVTNEAIVYYNGQTWEELKKEFLEAGYSLNWDGAELRQWWEECSRYYNGIEEYRWCRARWLGEY